jgi:oligopeptide transport system substrate-binding protein
MKKILACLLFLCLACSRPSTDPARSTLRIAFSNHPATIDPRKSGDFASSTLICLLFEGLMRCKSGAEVEPGLAERVDISPDQRTYVFHLRKADWSDGHPVTAFDFEKSWKTILQPGFPSLCAYLLYPIKNAENCAKGRVGIEEVEIRALDERRLRVELERPTPYFLSLTAFPLFLPVPSHVEENSSDWDRNPSSALVVNGPFCVEKIAPNTEIALKKNGSFWNREQIKLERIQINIVSDESTALQMFERGQLDCIGGPLSPIPNDAIQALAESAQLRFLPMAASTFCVFNTETFPFSSKFLRKAFSSAIDREQIVREIAQEGQIPAERPLPPSLIGAERVPLVETSEEQSKIYFAKALEELSIDRSELKELTLFYRPNQTEKRLAQTLQRRWLEVFGVEIRLEQIDPKTHLQRLHERNFQISLASWIAQYSDPVNILERFKDRSHAKNYAGWEDESYILRLENASVERNPQKRMEILAAAEEILSEASILAPMYHWTAAALFHTRVKDFATTSSGGVLFERCSLNE